MLTGILLPGATAASERAADPGRRPCAGVRRPRKAVDHALPQRETKDNRAGQGRQGKDTGRITRSAPLRGEPEVQPVDQERPRPGGGPRSRPLLDPAEQQRDGLARGREPLPGRGVVEQGGQDLLAARRTVGGGVGEQEEPPVPPAQSRGFMPVPPRGCRTSRSRAAPAPIRRPPAAAGASAGRRSGRAARRAGPPARRPARRRGRRRGR
jgi:hypothetical protein